MNMSHFSTVVLLAAALTACAQSIDPGAPTAAALGCALPSNCVSTVDGGAAPLRFEGDSIQAMVRLKRTLAAYTDVRIVRSDATSVDAVFTTAAGFEDEVAFRLDAPQHRVDYRSRSRLGLFDFGKNRSRMREFAERFAASGG